MAGTQLNVISSCARSPYFQSTRNQAVNYGECAGRLTPLSLGNDKTEEYWLLRKSVALFDVPERPVEFTGAGAGHPGPDAARWTGSGRPGRK